MAPNIDIYRAANEFIMRYGDDADTQANMMADKMMARGGMEARNQGVLRMTVMRIRDAA